MWPFRKPGIYETTGRFEIDNGYRTFDVKVERHEYRADAVRKLQEYLGRGIAISHWGGSGTLYRFRTFPNHPMMPQPPPPVPLEVTRR